MDFETHPLARSEDMLVGREMISVSCMSKWAAVIGDESTEDRIGSIEAGKLANLVICDGHVLQPATQVKGLFIAGKPLPPTSRHTRLMP